VKKKLHKKLQLKSETLRYLDQVRGGSAGPTCADTCGEPETGTCTYASNALACASSPGGGCGSTFPTCTM
jgi:hypothetical protein